MGKSYADYQLEHLKQKETHHIKFLYRQTVVQIIEEYRNKEDSHGGPGYYPREYTVISTESEVQPEGLNEMVKKVAR